MFKNCNAENKDRSTLITKILLVQLKQLFWIRFFLLVQNIKTLLLKQKAFKYFNIKNI